MSTPVPKSPWYQFGLSSLFLLVTAVAVVCSFGECTHWVGPVVLAAIVFVSGAIGGLIAGRAGIIEGTLYGMFLFLLVLSGSGWWNYPFPEQWRPAWKTTLGVAVLAGGVLGGLLVRLRSKR
jgi:hypothetical protein